MTINVTGIKFELPMSIQKQQYWDVICRLLLITYQKAPKIIKPTRAAASAADPRFG